MKRKIITIDHEKCDGCGNCVPDCPEGALQIIDGKAHLVSDLFCDGLGACIGACPTAAMTIEEREAEEYSERKVMENVAKHGENVIRSHLAHLKEHGEEKYLSEAIAYLQESGIPVPDYEKKKPHQGCPGSMMHDMRNRKPTQQKESVQFSGESQLQQWPVQLHLVNPGAPYFDAEELLIAADCVPFTYARFHDRFLKERPLVVFCPKLDNSTDRYIDKLSEIIKIHGIKRVSVVRMEVPCCGGATMIAEEAARKSGVNPIVREYTVSINGEII
jgi:ferredoxin